MPPELRLPKTLDAACDRESLEAALRAELPTSRQPLERFLVDGGWPLNAIVRVKHFAATAESQRLELSVTFDELVTSCGGGGEERPRLADFALSIDRATAKATIEL